MEGSHDSVWWKRYLRRFGVGFAWFLLAAASLSISSAPTNCAASSVVQRGHRQLYDQHLHANGRHRTASRGEFAARLVDSSQRPGPEILYPRKFCGRPPFSGTDEASVHQSRGANGQRGPRFFAAYSRRPSGVRDVNFCEVLGLQTREGVAWASSLSRRLRSCCRK
jgi:hypothetical protein